MRNLEQIKKQAFDMTIIINAMLKTGTFHNAFNNNTLFKKKESSLLTNYRPIFKHCHKFLNK